MIKPVVEWHKEKKKVLKLAEEGLTLREIGDIYGVSRQRVKQVFDYWHIPNSNFGKGVLRVQRQEVYRKKWGNKVDSELYAVQRAKFRAKKTNAKRSGLEWTIHFGDLDWPVNCPVFGFAIDYFAERLSENSPTFDRKDPDVGYTPENTRIISWRANRIKNDGSAEEHERLAEYIRTGDSI